MFDGPLEIAPEITYELGLQPIIMAYVTSLRRQGCRCWPISFPQGFAQSNNREVSGPEKYPAAPDGPIPSPASMHVFGGAWRMVALEKPKTRPAHVDLFWIRGEPLVVEVPSTCLQK